MGKLLQAGNLYIDQCIPKQGKMRGKNLAMAKIDYQKVCDMVRLYENVQNIW